MIDRVFYHSQSAYVCGLVRVRVWETGDFIVRSHIHGGSWADRL